jgi:hypothetical protein
MQVGVQKPTEREPPTGNTSPGRKKKGKAAKSAEPEVKDEIVSHLCAMGFSMLQCRVACIAVNNAGVEQAADWLLANLDKVDTDPSASTSADHSPPEQEVGGQGGGGETTQNAAACRAPRSRPHSDDQGEGGAGQVNIAVPCAMRSDTTVLHTPRAIRYR